MAEKPRGPPRGAAMDVEGSRVKHLRCVAPGRARVAPAVLKRRHALAARARSPPRRVIAVGRRTERHPGAADERTTRADVRVEAGRTNAVRRGHVEGRRPGAIEGGRAVSPRKDLGLRPDQRLGVGRVQRRVRHRSRGCTRDDQAQAPVARSERRLPAVRRGEGAGLFPAVQLRAVSEPAKPGRLVRRRLRQLAHRRAAPGHPAAEILRAVLGVVPHAEDALLPVRLVLELVAGRSGPGRRRRQPDVELQPARQRRGRHHLAARGAKHRRAVPLLARCRRSPDRRRVLSRVVHLRCLAQRRVPHQGQVHGDVRQQPEHARRKRGAAR